MWVILNDIAGARVLHFTNTGGLKLCHYPDNLWWSEGLCPLFVMHASDYDVMKLWISLHLPTDLKESCYEILSFFVVDCCLPLKVFISWRRRQQAALKRHCLYTKLHRAASHVTRIFILCSPTYKITHLHNVCLHANTCTEHAEVPTLLYGHEWEINYFLYSSKYSFHTFEKPRIPHHIFINCSWVVSRWQYTFTHKQYTKQHK